MMGSMTLCRNSQQKMPTQENFITYFLTEKSILYGWGRFKTHSELCVSLIFQRRKKFKQTVVALKKGCDSSREAQLPSPNLSPRMQTASKAGIKNVNKWISVALSLSNFTFAFCAAALSAALLWGGDLLQKTCRERAKRGECKEICLRAENPRYWGERDGKKIRKVRRESGERHFF